MKTVQTNTSVEEFIENIENAGRREDSREMLTLMSKVTGAQPRMWGKSIIGFGEYDYTRADGTEHKFMVTGFSPRKANLVVYIITGVAQYADRLAKLGKFKHSISCLYLPRLGTLDLNVLEGVIKDDIAKMKTLYEVRI